MILSRVLLVLSVVCALALIPRAQDNPETVAIEDDYRVTGVDERLRAVEKLRSKVDELRNAGQLVEAARTLDRVGRFQIRMLQADEAVTTFQEALRLLDLQPNDETRIESLNGLASSYDHLSRCNLAEPLATEALAQSKQINYVAGQADALLILSDCQNLRDHALALKSAQQALDLWSSIRQKRGMARAQLDIGHYQMALNNLPESEASFQAALSLYRDLNVKDQEASILIYLGFLEYRRGAWQNALTFYSQAQAITDERAEPYLMGQITAGLGEVFLESGIPDAALPKFREALSFFRLSKNQRAVTAMNWSIGRAQYMLGEYSDALESLQKARADAASNNDPTLTAFCEDFLGRAYYALTDYDSALSHFQSALDGYEKAGNKMERSRTLALMGQVYQGQGDLKKAWNNYETAIKMFRALADRVNESATLYAMGNLKLRENDLNGAESYLQQSIDATENIRRVSTTADLAVAFSATVHDRYEAYIECLMRKHFAGPAQRLDVSAFEKSELARGRSLADLLRATQTNLAPGLDPQIAEREKSLRQSLRVKEDSKVTLLAKQYKQEELLALDSELSRLEAEYKQVTEAINARYPSYTQINRPKGWNLSQIQEQVIADEQTVLLEYSLGNDKSYVWAITRNDIKSYELPARDRINEAAEKVYRLLTTIDPAKSGDELSQATRELGQMILSPVGAELNKERMIVVADGALHYIPFQILPASSSGDESLVATTEIINAPSASILGQLREETGRRQAPTRVLVAFGDPIFESNYAQRKGAGSKEYVASVQPPETEQWRHALRDIEPTSDSLIPAAIQPLRYARRELANLRNVAGPESLMVTGFDATREKLASADLTKYAILHFATHGLLDPKRPEKSGLLLSTVSSDGREQNGFVGLQDIYRLYAPVDLVVLSACRTGLGKDVRGEGLIGLTRGFMYAGASSVVASLWQVDDEATATLMKEFYTNLVQKSMPPAAALRAAQNTIRQNPEWRAPYYWAAFTVQGEYRQVIRPASADTASRDRKLIVVVAVLVLVAAAAWWYRRHRRTRLALDK